MDTGTDGDLYAVRLRPSPGTVGVSTRASFELSWTNDDPPPARFDVELIRYHEGSGGDEDTSEDAEFSKLTRRDDSYVWDLDIADASGTDTDLEAGGVYIVRLRSGADEIETVYVAARDRSRVLDPATAPAGIPNETGVAVRRHTVLVR